MNEQLKDVIGVLGIASVFVAIGAGTYKLAERRFRSPAGAFGCSMLVSLACLALSLAYGVYVIWIKPLPSQSLINSCRRVGANVVRRDRAGRYWFECGRQGGLQRALGSPLRSQDDSLGH